MKKLLAVAAAAAVMGIAGSASAAVQMLTTGGFRLQDNTFGSGEGVHWDGASTGVITALAVINQDNSHVTISSSDTFDTNGNGEATVTDGNGGNADPFSDLKLVFEHGWGALTFSFAGGPATMTVKINGVAVPQFNGGAGGNCSFCLVNNGNTGFSLYAAGASQINQVEFGFDPSITGARQFRLADVAMNSAAPEPMSWAMMIVGFGGVGALMRRRRLMAA